ncbi:MFS general substrate transporter [Hypoxylon sp. EC38]|nr:MFS general substrate transporter [Hypoxylon sp. EC38]
MGGYFSSLSATTDRVADEIDYVRETMFGMLIFGYLADRYGRKTVYGLELSIVVFATIGMTTAYSGHEGSMNVYGWIGFCRTLLGIGLGAGCPLSAIIAAEWSSTKSRGRMMAAVFLMQSVGQVAAYALHLAILRGISKSYGLSPEETNSDNASKVIDIVWRTTIGIGAVPALISLFLRRIIPETPHYLVEKRELANAVAAVSHVLPLDATLQPTDPNNLMSPQSLLERAATNSKKSRKGKWGSIIEYIREIKEHLAERGRWRALLGVMVAWWILDLAYYGLGLDNPKIISTILLSENPPEKILFTSEAVCDNATWRSDPAQLNITIYDMLQQDSIRNIMTISSRALPRSIIILLAIDYLPRTTWMGWMFVALAAIFAVNGGTLFITFETNMYALTVTFDQSVPYGHKLAAMLLAFSPAMLLGALVTWVWIPEDQYPRGHDDQPERSDNTSDNEEIETTTFRQKLKLPNRPLADIARNQGEGQILGMRRNIARLFRATRTRGTDPGRLGKPTHGEFQMGEADVGDALGIMQVRYN